MTWLLRWAPLPLLLMLACDSADDASPSGSSGGASIPQAGEPSAQGGTPGSSGSSAGGGDAAGTGGTWAEPGNAGSSGEPSAGGTGGAAGTSSAAAGAATGGGTAGQPAAGAGGVAGAPLTNAFTLLFRDDLDTLDPARWQLMTHSWESNLALFSAEAVSVRDGVLTLALMNAPAGTIDDSGSSKSFLGAEVRSRQALTYGRVRTRAKLAKGPAVVSALVTIYTPWPADDWNELDIECLGKDPTAVQFNTMVYTGPPTTPPVTVAVSPTQDPRPESLGFDASAAFHTYTIEWTPAGATFSIDDVPRYTWDRHIDLMKLPQNVLLTIWASASPEWAGAVTAQTTSASATFDWIELYRYTP